MVLFLPGYAIVRLTIDPVRLRLRHVLLASGLSMGITIFGGFLLHALGAMTQLGWAALLGGITVAALAVAARRSRLSMPGISGLGMLAELSRGQVAMIVCAAGTVVGAFFIAREGALAHKEFLATEFWMVPQFGCCPNGLTLGIRNLEDTPAEYEVEIMLEGEFVGAWRSIALQPNETWTSEANLRFRAGSGRRAEAWLFKNHDHRTIYRRVWADIGRV
ncbi:MAG: hypothetical protein ACHQAY_13050 [Hyphomicrobiales bacterium]